MAKQILRLTENDLHFIIRESVNRILKEETEADLEAAKAKLAKAKKSGNKADFLAAAKEYQRIKELLGKTNIIKPDVSFSKEENKKRGITRHGKFGRPNDVGVNKAIQRDDKSKLQVNDVDAIMDNK